MNRVYHDAAVNVAIKLTVLDCASCGIVFGITTELQQRRREDGNTFYCPNGHKNCWRESEHDKQLRLAHEQTERLRRQLEQSQRWERHAEERAKTAERSRAAIKGEVTKLRKRLGAGVCPYCTRHFTALERHIQSKHPGKPLPAEAVE